MRKVQKKQIQEIMESLNEAHEEIQKLLKQREYKTAQAVLADCQQCAIEVGNAIEESEGENCEVVKKIETYCETVFLLYNQIETIGALEEDNNDTKNLIAHDKVYKEVQQEFKDFSSEIDEIVVRKEVVFFPYKASMWDSLESIYLAAKEDENCDAYCVPIPYYDRNPDRSLGQMHYEGNEYPKNIEVIDWQTYNFEERRPDAIYIHNPYDDWNLVTCVHPRYFSSNLKKYTDKLVYIPYFVLGEIEPDDQAGIDGIKHFCFLPGVVNADQVIVQSEKIKQIYVNEYLKAAQENGLQGNHINRKYLEEKFLGLGSPKFDKVLHTKKEDLEIPEEWLKIIKKPDGSWKTIIFYNTSIAALLENNEKMLEKMRDVFKVFKETKDEVALLWRPHPLMKSTVSSMRPQLWVEYEKIVNRYKEENWGIYDDSADMDRAVVLSDVYYGDGSSVVQVYQKTGKPVMIQDVNAKNEPNIDKDSGVMLDAVIPQINITTRFDNSLYFIASNYNALFSIDILTGNVNMVSKMKNETKQEFWLGNANVYNDKLIICPFNYSKIHIWDIKENREIEIKNIDNDRNTAMGTPKVCIEKAKAFLIPSVQSSMYILDMEMMQVEGSLNIQSKYEEYFGNKYSVLTRSRGYIYDNYIYFVLTEENSICGYSIEKETLIFYSLDTGKRFVQSAGVDKYLILLSADGVLFEWNIETGKLNKIADFIIPDNKEMIDIQENIQIDENIYFLAPRDTWCVKYNMVNKSVIAGKYSEIFQFSNEEIGERYHYSSIDNETNIYFISDKYNLRIVNTRTNVSQTVKLKFDIESIKEYWSGEKQ